MALKYKAGDRVKIKSLDWYNENKSERGFICFNYANFVPEMSQYCGKLLTIKHVVEDHKQYFMSECAFAWTDEMIEGLAEEEKKLSDESWRYKNIFDHSQYPQSFECPEGYIFKDENGNVIKATKIVLEKKKKEYPKTFEECVHVLEGENRMSLEQMNTFRKLIDARNAYWKLYGEEMGLGKPWEPSKDEMVYSFYRHSNKIETDIFSGESATFEFPTAEMRDAFKENFGPDIEICKELL